MNHLGVKLGNKYTLPVPKSFDKVRSSDHYDSRFLLLDQTTPQTVMNGAPVFGSGLKTGIINAKDANGLSLFDDGGNGVFVQDGGNVGIGTTAPGAKLQIDAAASGKGLIVKVNPITPGNIFEAQSSSGTVLTKIKSGGEYDTEITSTDNAMLVINNGTGRAAFFRKIGSGTGLVMQANTSGSSISGDMTGGDFSGQHFSSGTINSFAAGRFYFQTLAGSGYVGTINLVDVSGVVQAAGSVIGNIYGINIVNITGATNNYAIYTRLGDVRIGDDLILSGADSDKIWLGAGKDSSIYYDGTDLKINPKEVGTGILDVMGTLDADAYSVGGAAGVDGTFTTADSKTVTVTKGIITQIL